MKASQITPDISGWKRINDHYYKEKVEEMPKISVIVPSFNSAHLLGVTLESILIQKNVDKEIIIVDASSTDHTSALIEKYQKDISRVYYLTNEKITLMLHKGFALATGEYISFLLPGMQYINQYTLSHISHLALEDLRPEVIFSGTYLVWPEFTNIKEAFSKSLVEIETQFIYFPFNATWLRRGFLPTSPCSMWFKRDYLQKLGGINYKTKILRKSIYELLCKISKDKTARIHTTFWSTTYSDHFSEKRYLNQTDILSTWPLILKYFGLYSALTWIFRDKPVNFFNAFISKVSSFFRE